MLHTLFTLAIIGFLISVYAYMTEEKIKKDPNFKPACDLSDRISCSKPLKSEYANLFYISNTIAGILFYAFLAVLAFFNMAAALFYAAIAACVASVYLAYLLYFKIGALCLICTSLYIVNALLLFFSYKQMFQ
jgi:vitamin-K-epoxide reductase (warfarin-sensitive)